MLCENCKTNPATVHLQVQRNQEFKELHLCRACYEQVKSELQSPLSNGSFSWGGGSPFEDLFSGMFSGGAPQENPQVTQTMAQPGGGGLLEQLGHNLSADARKGLVDPVIGRDKEVARVIEILNRRNKNNPVLIGEPGVGKTAIVEGLALKISEGKVPAKLMNKQIYLLDVSSLVANTGIRGQFEQRMRQMIGELEQRPDVILFIDEIHQLVGAGSAEGSMDAGNILKPALARGNVQVIGATTIKEYRKIEKDAALERRVQPVLVSEPTVEESVEILRGLKPKYESFHQVSYTDEAIRSCVTLSHRYIHDRFLPDKAIDLMDEAGSKANLALGTGTREDIQKRLQQLTKEKQEAVAHEAFEKASQLRDEEMKLKAKLNETQGNNLKVQVTLEQIQEIVEEKTGIPVRKLQESEQHQLKDLESRLHSKVIGQEEAVMKVAKAIRRGRAGLKAANRPIGSFLFVGPTGVGKTELAKRLAEELFGSQNAMIRLDMSEYMEKHSISKLIGSPPGYVGYDDAGQLTEQVRRRPYSLILLDEIEKAHPDVQHAFLQIMDDGRLTDSQGRVVSFKDTIIIMTSNAGTLDRKASLGFGRNTERAVATHHLEALKNYFKPEFLNRFDSIVEFHSLGEKELLQIVNLLLNDVKASLAEQKVALSWTQEAVKQIAAEGYHPAFGARPLRRVIQEQVEDKIADVLLESESVGSVNLVLKDGVLTVESAA